MAPKPRSSIDESYVGKRRLSCCVVFIFSGIKHLTPSIVNIVLYSKKKTTKKLQHRTKHRAEQIEQQRFKSMNPDCGSVNTYSSINLHQDRVRPELNQLMIGGRTLSHLSLLYCSKANIVSLQVIHFCPSAVSSSLRILLSSVFPEAPSVDSNNAILDSDNWVCHLQTACQPELTTASGQSRRDGSDTGEEYKKT